MDLRIAIGYVLPPAFLFGAAAMGALILVVQSRLERQRLGEILIIASVALVLLGVFLEVGSRDRHGEATVDGRCNPETC